MAETGVNVKALDSLPELLYAEEFYYTMYGQCGAKFDSIVTYCSLFNLTPEETLEAIDILNKINTRV